METKAPTLNEISERREVTALLMKTLNLGRPLSDQHNHYACANEHNHHCLHQAGTDS